MSNQPAPPQSEDAAAAFSQLSRALAQVADLATWQLSDADLAPAVAAVEDAARRISGQALRFIAEAGSRGLPGRVGANNLSGWVRHTLPTVAPGEAAVRARDAELLFTDPVATELTPTREQLLAGDITLAQARVVTGAVVKLSPPVCPPGVVDADTLAEAQSCLLEHAAVLDSGRLARLAAHLTTRLDPAAGDRLAKNEKAQAEARGLTLVPDSTGMWHLAGHLTPQCGHALATAIDAWSAPQPASDGTPDQRTAAQRRHDGLQRLCEQAIASPDLLPTTHGSPYRITVTVTHDTLIGQLPIATLPDGTLLSPLTLDVLACDAEVMPILVDEAGNPLDVADTQYAFPRKQRQAVAARDGHCSYPNCQAPPPWCHIHHLQPASTGGVTAVANAAMLCGRHHRHIHATGQRGQIIDGQVQWQPPGRQPPASTQTLARAQRALDALVHRWSTRTRQ